MGELDITFRRLLRPLPRPILQLAFPRRGLEPLGPLDLTGPRGSPATAAAATAGTPPTIA